MQLNMDHVLYVKVCLTKNRFGDIPCPLKESKNT